MLLDCHLLTPQHNFVTKCYGFYLFHFDQRNAAACQKKKMKEGVTSSNNLSTLILWRVVEEFKVVHWSTKGLLLKIVQDAVQDALVPFYACITTE